MFLDFLVKCLGNCAKIWEKCWVVKCFLIHPYTAGMLLVFTYMYTYQPYKSNLIETCIYSDLIQSYFLLSTPNLIYYYIYNQISFITINLYLVL